MARWFLLALSLQLLALNPASATELTDLGHGLSYLRVQALDAAIKPLNGNQALVLDLRYVTISDESTTTFTAALAKRPTTALLFILVSPETPSVLGSIISKSSALTLGLADSTPTPKVIIHTDAGTDRRAYDALTNGTPLAQLISGKIDKERYDEATLVKEFKEGIPTPTAPVVVEPTTTHTGKTNPAVPADSTPSVVRLTDQVLQRAMNIHAALLTLRR